MIKFKYNDEGNLIAYKDGKKVGPVVTLGDQIGGEKATDKD